MREVRGVGRPPGVAANAEDSIEATISVLLKAPGQRVLDAGCGHRSRHRRAQLQRHRYVGIDVEPVGDCCATVDALPFETAFFDVVICRAVLQYVSRPERTLLELHRVLRPRGSLIGSVPFLEPWAWGSQFHFSPACIVRCLMNAGFEVNHLWGGWPVEQALSTAAGALFGVSTAVRWDPSVPQRWTDPFCELTFAASVNFVATA